MGTDDAIISTVELDDVILNTCGAENRPKLHRSLGGQADKVVGKVADVIIRQLRLADLFRFKLLDHSAVLVE